LRSKLDAIPFSLSANLFMRSYLFAWIESLSSSPNLSCRSFLLISRVYLVWMPNLIALSSFFFFYSSRISSVSSVVFVTSATTSVPNLAYLSFWRSSADN
jgi:hypothetical protein